MRRISATPGQSPNAEVQSHQGPTLRHTFQRLGTMFKLSAEVPSGGSGFDCRRQMTGQIITQFVGPATASLTRDGWSERLKRFAEFRPFRLPISRFIRPSRNDAAGIHIAEETGLRSSVHGGLPIGDPFAAILELPAPDRLTCVERAEHAAGAVNNQRATEWSAPRFRRERVRIHREPSGGAAVGGNPCIAK